MQNNPNEKPEAAKGFMDGIREQSLQVIKDQLSDPTSRGALEFGINRFKNSVSNLSRETPGKQLMLNAAEQLSDDHYIMMCMEILFKSKFKQDIVRLLEQYNESASATHTLFPEPMLPIEDQQMDRRMAIRKVLGAAQKATLAAGIGGVGTKFLASKEFNEKHNAAINTAFVGGMITSTALQAFLTIGITDDLADAIVNSIDKALQEKQLVGGQRK